MKLFSVSLLFLLIGVVVGALGLYGWNRYSALQTAYEKISQPEQSPNAGEMETAPSPATAADGTTEPAVANKGTVQGMLGYPSEFIPSLDVFVQSTQNPQLFFTVTTQENQQSFTMTDVTPGTYHVFAYPASGGSLAGGYTEASLCGLDVSCTDHSLVQIQVQPNQTTTGIKITDWYAPEGTFPSKPL